MKGCLKQNEELRGVLFKMRIEQANMVYSSDEETILSADHRVNYHASVFFVEWTIKRTKQSRIVVSWSSAAIRETPRSHASIYWTCTPVSSSCSLSLSIYTTAANLSWINLALQLQASAEEYKEQRHQYEQDRAVTDVKCSNFDVTALILSTVLQLFVSLHFKSLWTSFGSMISSSWWCLQSLKFYKSSWPSVIIHPVSLAQLWLVPTDLV